MMAQISPWVMLMTLRALFDADGNRVACPYIATYVS